MQEGMLFHSLYEESASAYFVQTSYRLKGHLHLDYVRKSLNELMKRYDVLRTVFIYENREQPLQVVLKEREMGYFYEDIREIVGQDSQKQADYIDAFKQKDRDRSFNMSKDVLMRVSILQADDGEYEFIWSHHHILMDGWCKGVLISEYAEIYSSYLKNRPYRLPRVKQFKTYIQWLAKQDKEKSRDFWKQYLDSYSESSSVPRGGGLSAGGGEGYKREEVTVALDEEETGRFNRLAAKNNATVNTILQAVWGVILGRYNGKQDVLFGAVVSGRPAEIADVESIVGIFINTIPVRIRFREQMTFKRLVNLVQEEAIGIKPHDHFPLVEIQTDSPLKQDLFDHILVCENFPIDGQIGGDDDDAAEPSSRERLELSNVESFVLTNYDFNVIMYTGDRLTIVLEYNGNVYQPDFIHRVAGHIGFTIRQILGNVEIPVEELTLIPDDEKEDLLNRFNQCQMPDFQEDRIYDLFQQQARRFPDRIAVSGAYYSEKGEPGTSITYGQLNAKANQLARALRLRGVGPNRIVGLMVSPSPRLLVGILGILKAGGAYLPIDPNYPDQRKLYMITDTASQWVLAEEKEFGSDDASACETVDADNMSLPDCDILYIDNETLFEGDSRDLPPTAGSDDLIYTIFTSGSTGRPKGAAVYNRGYMNLMNWYINEFGLNSDDSTYMPTSFSFDLTQKNIFGALSTGGTLYIPRVDYFDPDLILGDIEAYKVTWLNCTPSMFYKLVDDESRFLRLSSLRYLFLGGEAISMAMLIKWLDSPCCNTLLVNTYGPTECTDIAGFYSVTQPHRHLSIPVPIGKPSYNCTMYILDSRMRPVPTGIPGELCIGGDGVGAGYINRPEMTADKFRWVSFDGSPRRLVYRSGDLAMRLPNGNIEYIDRIDHQVKVRGFRIELGEIENRLLSHPSVKDAVVLVRTSESRDGGNTAGSDDKYICAYIVFETDTPNAQTAGSAELREYLMETLPGYMIPTHFRELEAIPLTPNGKLDRKALYEGGQDMGSGVEFVAPKKETEKQIAEAWKEILKLEKVGINDNFFEIGGNSLNIIRVNSHLKELLKQDIPVVTMFRFPTISSLAKHLAPENAEESQAKKEKELETLNRVEDSMKETMDLFDSI